MADTAYDADHLRQAIAAKGALAVIPNNPSRALKYPLDKHLYAQRHLVECCFSKLKQFRRVATRFEKTARNYRAVVTLAAIILWMRERRADHANRRLVADGDDLLVSGWRLRGSGCSIGEPRHSTVGWPDQRGATRDRYGEQRDDSKQHHVAVFFANSHARKTRKRRGGSCWEREARRRGWPVGQDTPGHR